MVWSHTVTAYCNKVKNVHVLRQQSSASHELTSAAQGPGQHGIACVPKPATMGRRPAAEVGRGQRNCSQ